MKELEFYDRYVKLLGNLRDIPDRATPFKIDYLKRIIKNNKVYKFISFDCDSEKISSKINTLKQGKIWFAFYKLLNDKTEFEILYDIEYISKITGHNQEYINLLVNFVTQMYDVFSLSYEYHEYMWEDYAANGNGICIEFTVRNYDYLYPVEYIEKAKIDFNQMVINALQGDPRALSIIPWVIKNPYNFTENLDSTKEKEVRMLYSPFDKGELNLGKLEYNLKEKMGYKGIAELYKDFELKISNIIIGDKCNSAIANEIIEYSKENKIKYIFK